MTRLLKRPYVMVAAVALLLAATNAVRADFVVYNNFGPANGGNDFNGPSGWFVGDSGGNTYVIGESFTANKTGTLSQITLALEYFGSGPNAGVVKLQSDSGAPDFLPAGVLESWNVGPLPTDDGNFHTPISLTDASSVTLTAGTTYWVVAYGAIGSALSWQLNNTGALGSHAESDDGGSNYFAFNTTQGAFRVTELDQTSSAPAPGAIALLVTGLGTLAGYRLRRRRT
jgi:hypothetical protein